MPKNTKLSDVISSQFPNFVQDDYQTFIAFLEAYYTYLDQQKLTRSLEYIKDIDKTLDEFIGFIRREISPETPQNNKFFMQHAKKAQLARGSEDSYRTLFRFLLKKEINIQYPAEKMLRVSGGQWEQDTSFFLKVSAGDPFKLQNNFLYIECSKKQIFHRHRVYVKKVQRIETTLDVYEVFIAKNFYGLLDVDDTVNYNGVIGVIQPTTSKVKIVNPGSGFKVGQVFNISTSSASGLLVKVAKTDQEGRLKQLQIISFGVGFKKNFYYNITRFQALASSQTISEKDISQVDVLTDGNDAGVMNRVNYHNGYAEGNYVGDVLADFYAKNIPEESEQTVASILVELGAISKYPGYYKSSNSLIDDDSYIQDGEYYQDFSYVIKIDEKLDKYRDTVLSIVHPVGRKLFGEYQIESNFELNLEISNPVIRILIPQFSESDETIGMMDKTIYQIKDFTFNGDGFTNSWTLYIDQNPAETVVLSVKINGETIERYTNWDISGNDLILSFAPDVGDIIETRYAIMSYSGSELLYDAIFDVDKNLSEIATDLQDGISTKGFSKTLIPAFGYDSNIILGGSVQSEETDIRSNLTSKLFPSLEILSGAATPIEKDTLTIGDTGTTENGLPETNLTIKGFGKALTSSSANPITDANALFVQRSVTDIQSIQDTSQNKLFSKTLAPQFGYIDEAKMTNGTGATESDSTDFTTKFVTKPLTDEIVSALFTEVLTRSISKPLASSSDLPLADATIYSFSKSIPSGISFADPNDAISIKAFSKALVDITDGAIDAISTKGFSKALADITDGAIDAISTKGFSKALSDSIDAAGFTHTSTFLLNKAALVDSIDTPIDSTTRVFNKYLTDSVTPIDSLGSIIPARNVSDTLTINDALTKVYTETPVNDTAAATDTTTASISKNFSDETNLNNTGYLQLNPYSSELSYFAEEYSAGRTNFTS